MPKAVIDACIGHDGDTGEDYTTVGRDSLRLAAGVLSARGPGPVPGNVPGTVSVVRADERQTISTGTA